jgi:anaerobic magnesium-protoporphyrin IX monomethyl ester cyclase
MWPFHKPVSQRADGVKNRVIIFFPAVDEPLSLKRKYQFPLSTVSLVPKLIKKKFRVHIFDERIQFNCRELIEALLPDAVCFGVSSMTGFQILRAIEMVKFVRDRSSVPVVWGGWHVSLLPEQSANSEHIDYIVHGQGEETFSELVEIFANGARAADLKKVRGIAYKEGDKILITPARPVIPINELEPMPYSYLDIQRYRKYYSYLSSLGCPMHCGFCADAAVYKGKWFALEAERVVEELDYLIKRFTTHTKNIFFIDSNFFVNRRRVEEICELIMKRGLKFKWTAMGHPKQMARYDDHFFDLLYRSGCFRLLIGAESGSQKILDYINKNATIEDNKAFILKATRAKIQPNLSMMCGFPGAPEDDLRETITFMNEVKSFSPKAKIKLFFFTPYPGSPLYVEALKQEYKPPNSLEGWAHYTLRQINMPYLDLNYEKLVRFFVEVYYRRYAGKDKLDWDEFVRLAREAKL